MSASATLPNVSTGLKLELKRTIAADPMAVFHAWTDPEALKNWFFPGPVTVAYASTDPRPGGAYRIDMQGATPNHPGENTITSVHGVYTEFVPGKLLVFTWGGGCSPDGDTLVTIALRPVEGGTELTLIHEGLPTQASLEAHEGGWTQCLASLANLKMNR